MVGTESWWDWVKRHLDERTWSQADLARNAEIDLSVIHRWRSQGAQPSPKNAARVASAFGRPVVDAAVAAGHYTREELKVPEPDLKAFSNDQLLAEVRERMGGDGRLQQERRTHTTGGGKTTNSTHSEKHQDA